MASFMGGVSDTLGTSGLNGFKTDASYLPGGGTSATGVNGANAFENGAGSYGTHIGTAVGLNNPGGQSAAASQQQSIQNQIGAEQGVINNETQQGNQYYGGVQNATNNYTQSLNNNTGNYINTQTEMYDKLNPQYQQLTNNAMSNANGAETLQQAQTPNNAIEQGVQGMYNTQAQGITNQGLADYGVLAALGGQATANTIGGAGQPVTGGQMQALQGANMGQASQAFGQAQNQANTLKAQGLQAGINQNNIDYGEGQQAQQTAQGALAQQGNFENQNASNTLGAYMGAAQGNYNANANLAGVQYGIQQGQDQSQMGMINQTYGAQQQADISAAQAANAQQAGKLGAIGSFAGAIGGGLASMYSPRLLTQVVAVAVVQVEAAAASWAASPKARLSASSRAGSSARARGTRPTRRLDPAATTSSLNIAARGPRRPARAVAATTSRRRRARRTPAIATTIPAAASRKARPITAVHPMSLPA